MDIKELTRLNAEALKRTIGEKLTCPMCGNKHFVVVGGYVRNDIQTQLDGWVMGSGNALNMAVVVCQHCGFVSHHDIAILGRQFDDGESNGSK